MTIKEQISIDEFDGKHQITMVNVGGKQVFIQAFIAILRTP